MRFDARLCHSTWPSSRSRAELTRVQSSLFER
jgi:hypothetical protein